MANVNSKINAALAHETPHLYRYAFSLMGNRADAEDLTQNSIVRALRNLHRFKRGTNLRGWLFTIMKNLYIDERRKKRRRGHQVPLEDWYSEMSYPPAQENRVVVGEVAAKLRTLRREDQQVVMMSAFMDLRQEQIADRLNIAVGTVKSRLCRARRAIAAG